MVKSYYNTLGVREDASIEEIRKAFWRLSQLYHPDVNHGQDSEETFKEMSGAFDVLKNEEKRKKYDLSRHRNTIDDVFNPTNRTYSNGFTGFTKEDLENMFRQGFGEEMFNRSFRYSRDKSEYNQRKNDKETLRRVFVSIFCTGLILGALGNEYVTDLDIYPINEFIKPMAQNFGNLWAGTVAGGFTGGIIGFLYQGYKKLDFVFKA